MPRKKNPRRAMREMIKEARDIMTDVYRWWDVTGPRRSEEYPENQVVYWASTHQELTRVIVQLEEARDFAEREYRRVKAEAGEN